MSRQIQFYKKSTQIVGLMSPTCGITFLAGKHNSNPLNLLVHLQPLCAQGGSELGFRWRVDLEKYCSICPGFSVISIRNVCVPRGKRSGAS